MMTFEEAVEALDSYFIDVVTTPSALEILQDIWEDYPDVLVAVVQEWDDER